MRRTAIALCLLSLLAATASGAGTGAETLRLGGIPLQLLSARGQLWVLLCDRGCSGQARHSLGRVVEIDPRRERVIASATIARPGAIAVDPSGVYATDFWRDTVRRLDTRTLQPAASLKLRLPFFIVTSTTRDDAFLPEQLAVGDGSVWVASDRGALARVDAPLRRVSAMLRLPADAFQAIATAPGTVWLSESLLGLYRVDTHTNRVVARIPIGPPEHRFVPVQLITTGRRLLALGEWTNGGTATNDNGLARLDRRSNRVASVTGLLPGQLTAASGGRSLWVGRVNSHTLDQIDPASGKVIRRLHSHVGVELAFAGRQLWTISHNGNLERVPIR
jgi:DNA-binding beta-propeller fold protein YncE